MSEDSRELAVKPAQELSVDDVLAQLRKVQELMKRAMVEGEDYGTIPGTKKPTLYKPGAEKLLLMMRLDPQYDARETRNGAHLTVQSTCVLYHLVTGNRMGSGMGSCSTLESKYRWRNADRHCPECGADAIIKGKAQYGGGWLCFAKKGGCGAKFPDAEAQFQEQTGRVENPDIADQYNTVLKMANKRALTAAVLNVTGASQIFTQDIEDGGDGASQPAGAGGQGGRRARDGGKGGAPPSAPAALGPDDPSTAEQRAAFWRACKNHLGEERAKAWMAEQLMGFEVADAKQLKCGQLTVLYERLQALADQPKPVEEEPDIEY